MYRSVQPQHRLSPKEMGTNAVVLKILESRNASSFFARVTGSVTRGSQAVFIHLMQEEKTAVRYPGDRQQPSEWSSLVAVHEATAGAVQALVVMAGFVLFGLGWAALAEASQSFSQSAPTRVHSRAHQLDPDSLTRYREETRIASPKDCREIRHAQIERHISRYTRSTPFTRQDGCPG